MNDTIKSRQVGSEVWLDVAGTIVAISPDVARQFARDTYLAAHAANKHREEMRPKKSVSFIESKA